MHGLCITYIILYKNSSIFEFGYPQCLWGPSEYREMFVYIKHLLASHISFQYHMNSLVSCVCNFLLQHGETKPAFHYPQHSLYAVFLYVTNFSSMHTDHSLDPGPAGHPSAVMESSPWPHHIHSEPAESSAWLCQIHWPNP